MFLTAIPEQVALNTKSTEAYTPVKRYVLVLFLACRVTAALAASELTTIENVTLIESTLNDGDSFLVNADGRELYLRLYYVDCPETASGNKTDLERIREQQFHFGLEQPHDVARYGEQATEYVKQALSQPFTVHTGYVNALGRTATNRYYAFVETHEGQDLSYLLVENGLARIHGSTRPNPDGKPSHTVLEELQDLRTVALLKRAGIWQSTQPHILTGMRRHLRDEAEKLQKIRDNVKQVRTDDDPPLDLNTASDKELQSIPGIGPVTANKITAGRPYRSVEDLLKIHGIGKKTLEKIAPYVTVEGM